MKITNFEDGDVVTYSVVILTGEAVGCNVKVRFIGLNRNNNENNTFLNQKCPIINGMFKILLQLKHGSNNIELSSDNQTVNINLIYKKRSGSNRFVRPIYVLLQSENNQGIFQGPDGVDCSLESAKRRISTALLLMQSFTAEKLYENGLSRRSFELELNNNGQVMVDVFQSCHLKTLESIRNLTQQELWSILYKELKSSTNFVYSRNIKYLAFLSFTQYDQLQENELIPKTHSEILKRTAAYVALGGDNLAVFGSATLHTWAETINEVFDRFSDQSKIDRTRLMDDSAGRKYYWANYSTGLGSALHELGHTFDLAHTPTGIMARGFDDMYLYFTVHDHKSPITYKRTHTRKHSSGSTTFFNSQRQTFRSRSHSASSINRQNAVKTENNTFSVSLNTSNFKEKDTIRHYDGSTTERTVMRSQDGNSEIVSQIRTLHNGEKIATEFLQDRLSGRLKTTMSMSISSSSSCSSTPNESPKHSLFPSNLPDVGFGFQTLKYKDGGAHWYRSSAILLYYHKWFQEENEDEFINDKNNECTIEYHENGTFSSKYGLRLLEVRSFPTNTVLHHWEFAINTFPPVNFTVLGVQLKEIVGKDVSQILILSQDSIGTILKIKLNIDSLISMQASK